MVSWRVALRRSEHSRPFESPPRRYLRPPGRATAMPGSLRTNLLSANGDHDMDDLGAEENFELDEDDGALPRGSVSPCIGPGCTARC